MTHPTEPLTLVHGVTAAFDLIVTDDEGIAVDVSAVSGADLELMVRASAIEGESDLVRLEEADGIAHVAGQTGKLALTVSTARWASLSPNTDYVLQLHVFTGGANYWSHPFTLRLLPSFT